MSSSEVAARFDARVSHECWVWTGAPNQDGYGVFYVTPTERVLAHRWAYERAFGPIPEGWEVDHLCNVRMCVRPSHLEAITGEENNRRKMERRDSCKRGHPYSEYGGIRRGNGRRYCKECHRLYTQAYRSGAARGERLP